MIGTLLIGGPTGSGKSALALLLAEWLNGAIINADSMQLYRDLRIVTARPEPADQARVPHQLYGMLDAATPCSAGRWLDLAAAAINEVAAAGQVPIVVGGTGLYLHALLRGIAPVPEVPAAVRGAASRDFERLGVPGFHAAFAERDPAAAAKLHPSDRQRLIRAAEVLEATGQSIIRWQAEPPKRIQLPEPVVGVALTPPRAALHERIERRLIGMLEAGALDEIDRLRQRALDPELPLMKAVTVPEFMAHLAGEIDLATATARAVARSRQFAKRQLTWLRHQLPELTPLEGFGDDPELPSHLVLPNLGVLTSRGFAHTVRSAQ